MRVATMSNRWDHDFSTSMVHNPALKTNGLIVWQMIGPSMSKCSWVIPFIQEQNGLSLQKWSSMNVKYLFVMVTAQVLHERPDLVRITRVIDNVFNDGEHSGRMHFEGIRDPYVIDFYGTELVKVRQDFWMPIEKLLESLTSNQDQMPVKGLVFVRGTVGVGAFADIVTALLEYQLLRAGFRQGSCSIQQISNQRCPRILNLKANERFFKSCFT